jgi:glycosyltransferase involved in cell wall biosynthesis
LAPELASRFRSYVSVPGETGLAETAEGERTRIRLAWYALAAPERPQAWLTYHPYYKAPDLIGPAIAARFAIPYVTLEASFAGKRDRDAWADLQAVVKAGVRAAALNFCFTAEDRQGLSQIVGPDRLGDLAPFIDPEPFLAPPSIRDPKGPVRLVTVAMMRGGVKLASYEMLGRALSLIADEPWTLTIVGDGPQRPAVAAAFASLPDSRLRWAGELELPAVAAQLAASDIFVWPGTGEAYGIAFLEAQAAGLVVVAQAAAGVPTVVRHGVTGLLTPPGDDAAYSAAIAQLIGDAPLRCRLGGAARRFVTEDRSLSAAASRLGLLLAPLLVPAPVLAP